MQGKKHPRAKQQPRPAVLKRLEIALSPHNIPPLPSVAQSALKNYDFFFLCGDSRSAGVNEPRGCGGCRNFSTKDKGQKHRCKSSRFSPALRPGASLYIHAFGPQAPCSDPVNAGGGGAAAAAERRLPLTSELSCTFTWNFTVFPT